MEKLQGCHYTIKKESFLQSYCCLFCFPLLNAVTKLPLEKFDCLHLFFYTGAIAELLKWAAVFSPEICPQHKVVQRDNNSFQFPSFCVLFFFCFIGLIISLLITGWGDGEESVLNWRAKFPLFCLFVDRNVTSNASRFFFFFHEGFENSTVYNTEKKSALLNLFCQFGQFWKIWMRNPPFWKDSKTTYPGVGEAIGKLQPSAVNFSLLLLFVKASL